MDVSRRRLIEGAIVAASLAGFAARTGAQETGAAQKISHADAKYQPRPNGQQRCEICLQFEPPDRCKIVASPISPTGWCQFFAARENAH